MATTKMKKEDLKEKIRKRAFIKFKTREHWGLRGNHLIDYTDAEREVIDEHRLKFPEAY